MEMYGSIWYIIESIFLNSLYVTANKGGFIIEVELRDTVSNFDVTI